MALQRKRLKKIKINKYFKNYKADILQTLVYHSHTHYMSLVYNIKLKWTDEEIDEGSLVEEASSKFENK